MKIMKFELNNIKYVFPIIPYVKICKEDLVIIPITKQNWHIRVILCKRNTKYIWSLWLKVYTRIFFLIEINDIKIISINLIPIVAAYTIFKMKK